MTNMNKVCPECGEPVPVNETMGLCPNCLLNAAEFPAGNSTTAAEEQTAVPAGAMAAGTQIKYFGDYQLMEPIAEGGMGVVYKARQVSLNRIVALKMIRSGEFASEGEVRRFLAEAEAAANLQHPHIVAIHEVGEHERRHYFSMDYVAGKNLAERFKLQPMSPREAAALLKTIAEAVHFAHQRGTLHRDIKPHNVLIDPAGNPRITDFGLARRVDNKSDLTRTGSIMGSPSYMSPEQALGRHSDVGIPSDVYALGAVLYFLLTGRPPFDGESPMATLYNVVHADPVSPSALNDNAPAELVTICLKCLEKRPENRYMSAKLLAEDLDRFLKFEPILAKPAPLWRKAGAWAKNHPWVLTGGGAFAFLGMVALTYGLWQEASFLKWQAVHPGVRYSDYVRKLATGRTSFLGDALVEFSWKSYVACIPFFLAVLISPLGALVDYMFRKNQGQAVRKNHLTAYALMSSTWLILGVLFVMGFISHMVWNSPSNAIESAALLLLAGFSLFWLSLYALWTFWNELKMIAFGYGPMPAAGQPAQGPAPGIAVRKKRDAWSVAAMSVGMICIFLGSRWVSDSEVAMNFMVLSLFAATTVNSGLAAVVRKGIPRQFSLLAAIFCASFLAKVYTNLEDPILGPASRPAWIPAIIAGSIIGLAGFLAFLKDRKLCKDSPS